MFSEILEKELKKRKITLNRLAKEAGFSQSQTSKWKQGLLPGTEILIKICKYLNVSADYLLDLTPPTPPPNKMEQLEEQETILIEYYRTADNRGKEYIIETAKRESNRTDTKEKELSDLKIG